MLFITVLSLLTVYVISEEIFFPNMETEEIRMPAVVANLVKIMTHFMTGLIHLLTSICY